ncbi:serine/arginine repetitive matrix protein 3-like isoform X2 [Neocloeon triangulifer]|uniref:serine/arginine repetitive matrix protein 3-like isoform X2 n=1 Tax=Neocloeon triangulifer TaxID=2078957 RepID=UPI00286EBD7C|nr:serine/arginine repetitive matrix protein 3-like isoform X2 [Neocloeon triangulifer]
MDVGCAAMVNITKTAQKSLNHEQQRRIELKCIELEAMLEEQGLTQEEIIHKVQQLRSNLTDGELSRQTTSQFAIEKLPIVSETVSVVQKNEVEVHPIVEARVPQKSPQDQNVIVENTPSKSKKRKRKHRDSSVSSERRKKYSKKSKKRSCSESREKKKSKRDKYGSKKKKELKQKKGSDSDNRKRKSKKRSGRKRPRSGEDGREGSPVEEKGNGDVGKAKKKKSKKKRSKHGKRRTKPSTSGSSPSSSTASDHNLSNLTPPKEVEEMGLNIAQVPPLNSIKENYSSETEEKPEVLLSDLIRVRPSKVPEIAPFRIEGKRTLERLTRPFSSPFKRMAVNEDAKPIPLVPKAIERIVEVKAPEIRVIVEDAAKQEEDIQVCPVEEPIKEQSKAIDHDWSSSASSFSSRSSRAGSVCSTCSSEGSRYRKRRYNSGSASSRSSSSSHRSRSRSPSIPRRRGSPSFLERRRITSARKRPIPYHRSSPMSSSSDLSSSEDDRSGSSSYSARSWSRSRSRSYSC